MTTYPLIDLPGDVVLADVTGDGVLDTVVSEMSGTSLGVLAGRGDGTFAAEVTYPLAGVTWDLAAADLDGDGAIDLVAVLSDASQIEILLNSSDGGFRAGATYPTGLGPVAVTIGDVNRDGVADIVVSNGGDGSVSVLLGRGDGTFAAHVDFPAGATPGRGVLGDFNGDGQPDFAVTGGTSNTISVLWGTDGGGFSGVTSFSTEANAAGIAAADLDGDGIMDLLVADSSFDNGGAGWVTRFMGQTDGGFGPGQNLSWGFSPDEAALVDLNGDGVLDLALLNTGSASLGIQLGTGGGAFASQAQYSAGNAMDSPMRMAVGDLNGDGLPDVVMTIDLDGSMSASELGVFINGTCHRSGGSSSGSTGASGLTGCGGGGTTGGGSDPISCGFQIGCYLTSCSSGACQCIVDGHVTKTLSDAGPLCQDAVWEDCGFPPDPAEGTP